MNQRFGLFCILISVAAFGKDATQPVKKSSVELGIGYGYAQIPGYYDASGKFSDWDKIYGKDTSYSPSLFGIPMRAKYGLGGGFDVKFDWDAVFSNKDAGSLSGMSQPKLGIKYSGPVFGAYGNLTAPVATGNLDNGNLRTYLEFGGIVRQKLTYFRFTGIASFTEVFETSDILKVSLKPEILWTDHLSTYSTLSYLKSINKDPYLLTLTPGFRGDITENLLVDIAGAATLAGRSAPAGWSLTVIFYQTLGY